MSPRKGSRIAGTNYLFLDEGAYGTIFADKTMGRIRKLYRLESRPVEHCLKVFEAEVEALKIASDVSFLRPHIIAPIVRICDYQVLDANEHCITEQFIENAGFEGALVDGYFHKLGALNTRNKERLKQQFRDVGIKHLSDASVTLDANGDIAKIIDFSVCEHELYW